MAAKWIKTKYPGVRIKMAKWPGKPDKLGKVYWGRLRGKTYRLGDEWTGCTPLKASKLLADLKTGVVVPAKDYKGKTFAEGYEKYGNTFDSRKDKFKKELPGFKNEASLWRVHLRDPFGHRRVDSLTHEDINKFLGDLRATGLTPQTRAHIIKLLIKIAKYQDFTLKIDKPVVRNERVDMPADQAQYTAFVKHLEEKKHPVSDMMLISIYSGLRRGEVARLKWSDIDTANQTIYIGDQKNGMRSFIPLLPHAAQVIARQERNGSPYLFPGKEGGCRNLDKLTATAKRISLKFGMPKNHRPFHSLRHWFATMLASSGKINQYTLQQLLRHKDPSMTQRYSHLTNSAFDRVREISKGVF